MDPVIPPDDPSDYFASRPRPWTMSPRFDPNAFAVLDGLLRTVAECTQSSDASVICHLANHAARDHVRAAVSLCRRAEWILAVYNPRYHGYGLPGGLVHPNETLLAAQARELGEETGLTTDSARLIYDGPAGTDPLHRAGHIYLFDVAWKGAPAETEPGSPIAWFLPDELLKVSPFAPFYIRAFAALGIYPYEVAASSGK